MENVSSEATLCREPELLGSGWFGVLDAVDVGREGR
jgi:hypothetical protein